MQFATDHLGHFDLTTRLFPALADAEAPASSCSAGRGTCSAPWCSTTSTTDPEVLVTTVRYALDPEGADRVWWSSEWFLK